MGRVGWAVATGSLLAAWAATAGGHQEASPDEVIAAIREGGTTVVCRHAITDSFEEREPVDYDDPSTQRQLSPEGERQSVAMGRAMRRLDVQVTELIASPMRRAYRTAALMFDREPVIDPIWHTNGGSYGGAPLEARRRVLATPVEQGNRLIVSHIGTIASAIPSARSRLEEGDCVVTRARDGGHEVVGFVPWQAWEDAASR